MDSILDRSIFKKKKKLRISGNESYDYYSIEKLNNKTYKLYKQL
jgi:hypothetical protein